MKNYWDMDDGASDRTGSTPASPQSDSLLQVSTSEGGGVGSPTMFWSRVTNKPGNMPYVREKGEDMAVLNAVEAITYCLEDIPFDS